MLQQYVVQDSFTAQPYYGYVPPGAPLAQRPPKMFVKGTTIMADQVSMNGQPALVSNDMYFVDPTKVAVSLNPISVTQNPADVGMGTSAGGGVYQSQNRSYQPVDLPLQERPAQKDPWTGGTDWSGVFSPSNFWRLVIVMLFIFLFLKYMLPLIKSSLKKT